jgi:hypothetical protein
MSSEVSFPAGKCPDLLRAGSGEVGVKVGV